MSFLQENHSINCGISSSNNYLPLSAGLCHWFEMLTREVTDFRIQRIFVYFRPENWRLGNAGRKRKATSAGSGIWRFLEGCRHAIYEYTVSKERALLEANNLGKFYKHVNKKLSTKSGIGILCDADGNDVCDPTDQANLFSEFFASTYITDDGVAAGLPLESACRHLDELYSIRSRKRLQRAK